MKLTTGQTAEKLGITTATVRALIKRGQLHDIRTYAENQQRKNPLLASKEVNAFAKEYRRHQRQAKYTNGTNGTPTTGPLGIMQTLTHIQRRLTGIEEQTAALLKLWS